MKKILPESFFSKTCLLRGINDVDLNFDDSYMPNMGGMVIFLWFSIYKTTFTWKIILWDFPIKKKIVYNWYLTAHWRYMRDLFLERKKWCTIELW